LQVITVVLIDALKFNMLLWHAAYHVCNVHKSRSVESNGGYFTYIFAYFFPYLDAYFCILQKLQTRKIYVLWYKFFSVVWQEMKIE